MARSPTSQEHVAGVDILVDGADWTRSGATPDRGQGRRLADAAGHALIRITDPNGDNVDDYPLQIGKDVEVKIGGAGEAVDASIFKGQIAAVEPDFTPERRA